MFDVIEQVFLAPDVQKLVVRHAVYLASSLTKKLSNDGGNFRCFETTGKETETVTETDVAF